MVGEIVVTVEVADDTLLKTIIPTIQPAMIDAAVRPFIPSVKVVGIEYVPKDDSSKS